MAERRKSRKKREISEPIHEEDKPSKVEYAVAKYLRNKLPVKKTTLLSHKVEYFIASKAVDCLMESSWAKGRGAENIFTTRESVVKFLEGMLRRKFFHRARKVVVQKEQKKKKKDKEDEGILSEDNKDKKQKAKLKGKETKEKEKDIDKGKRDEDEEGEEKKREKKKFKLDMHLEQIFVDGNEAYVWIYDPISAKAWIVGSLTVFGAIALCLFPLWPKTFRHYVYYLSVAAAGFLIIIVGLAIFRLIVFILVWILTLGKHHVWLLPNLTEDVGFFESFWPLYKYEYKGTEKDYIGTEREEKTDNETVKKKPVSEENDSGSERDVGVSRGCVSDVNFEADVLRQGLENGDNGFEIVDREDLQQQSDSENS